MEPTFNFKAGDKVRINDWRPGRYVTVIHVGTKHFFCLDENGNECLRVISPSGTTESSHRWWEPHVDRVEYIVTTELRCPKRGDRYVYDDFILVANTHDASVDRPRLVIVGVRQA